LVVLRLRLFLASPPRSPSCIGPCGRRCVRTSACLVSFYIINPFFVPTYLPFPLLCCSPFRTSSCKSLSFPNCALLDAFVSTPRTRLPGCVLYETVPRSCNAEVSRLLFGRSVLPLFLTLVPPSCQAWILPIREGVELVWGRTRPLGKN